MFITLLIDITLYLIMDDVFSILNGRTKKKSKQNKTKQKNTNKY